MNTTVKTDEEMKRILEGRRYAQARSSVLGLKQTELAKKLGRSVRCVREREQGRFSLSLWHWLALCGIEQMDALDGLGLGTFSDFLKSEGKWQTTKDSESSASPHILDKKLARTLQGFRESCGMSVEQWACSLGTVITTIYNIEQNETGITRELFLAQIALFLQVKFHRVDKQRTTHHLPKITGA